MARTDFHKVIIGRSESLHFMDYAMADIPAKVDTGAYRSAVHADNISVSEDGKTLHFRLLGGHPVCGALATEMTTEDFKVVRIANSFGHTEERYEVKLKAKLGPKIFTATFSLADRGKKIYPILLGRKMLNNRFLVDTSEAQINRIELKQKYGISFPIDEEEGR
ncbi:MAG: ATP-dependent zinc protease family protein [Candidatus Saccharibacteria bacterium]